MSSGVTLRANTLVYLGMSASTWAFDRTVPVRGRYCDLNKALSRELRLGGVGLAHAEGGR
jgi:hypothetical protein